MPKNDLRSAPGNQRVRPLVSALQGSYPPSGRGGFSGDLPSSSRAVLSIKCHPLGRQHSLSRIVIYFSFPCASSLFGCIVSYLRRRISSHITSIVSDSNEWHGLLLASRTLSLMRWCITLNVTGWTDGATRLSVDPGRHT